MDPTQDPSELDMAGESDDEKKPEDKKGRRKIKIELIEDKSRRHITFSKRKLGIMKKVRLSNVTTTGNESWFGAKFGQTHNALNRPCSVDVISIKPT